MEYKAELAGLSVVYVDARGTSSLCPICGES
ncbi:MAG: transposase [Thaumarchaeota archaeon]|nr:transposase [Candidatus Geocrenenecus arthurdayi]